jgi:hypothetical protein
VEDLKPAVICHGKEKAQKLSANRLRTCIKRFAKQYVFRMEDHQYGEDMVFSMSSRLRNVTIWSGNINHH